MKTIHLKYGHSLAGIVAAGALLRFALLARQPLGYDEDFTAAVVARPFGEMIGAVSRDSGPPLFYAVEWVVAQVSREPAALRLVPALAGIALIPLLAALARRVAGDAAALWAAALTAALPATVLVSLNARMYAPAGLFVVAAILLGSRALETGRSEPVRAIRRWIAYAVAAGLAVWTDYFAAVALVGVLAAFIYLRPPRALLAAAAVATLAAFASLLPWLVFADRQFDHAGQGFWVPPLGLEAAAGTLAQLFAGPPVDHGVTGREILVGLQSIAVVAGFAALVAAAVWAYRSDWPARRRAIFMLAACSGAVVLLVASFGRPLFEARYLGVMWLPLFALAGVGLAAMSRRAASLVLVAVAVPSLALGTTITHPQTSDLIPMIESRLGPNDLVAADPSHYLALLAQGNAELKAHLHVLSSEDPPWYFGTAAYPPGAVIHEIPASVIAARGRIFWVSDGDATMLAHLSPDYWAEGHCLDLVCLVIYSPAAP